MQKFQKDRYITINLYKSYNANYNTKHIRNTSVSRLVQYVQQQRLSDALEMLERLGYSESDLLVTLAAVQTLQQLGGV